MAAGRSKYCDTDPRYLEGARMKTCPLCRMEARNDADWCWHCGYSYEEDEARSGAAPVREPPAEDGTDPADDLPANR